MRVKAASWMKYGLRIRISGGSLGTRVATDFQKPSDALCGHSTAGRELGTQLRGDCVRGRDPQCLQANEKQGGGRDVYWRYLGHVGSTQRVEGGPGVCWGRRMCERQGCVVGTVNKWWGHSV